jgi:hypothetical protein
VLEQYTEGWRGRSLSGISPVEYALSREGWMNNVELEWLSNTARSLKPGAVWLEVGSWFGRSWSCVGLSLPKSSTIIAVDTFLGERDEPLKWVQERGSAMHYFTMTHEDVRKERPDLYSLILAMRSTDAARFIADRFCDVIFIDGDHSTEAVRADIAAWKPKLKNGGLMCGHDAYDPAVKEGLRGFDWRSESKTTGSIWYLK